MQRFRITAFFSVFLTIFSCTSDKTDVKTENCDEVITYDNQVRGIILNSCAYSGCHVAGFSSGDFTSLQGLQPYLNNGKFSARVILQQNMPPFGVPDNRPDSLSDDQIKMLTCWEQNDFAE